MVYRSLRVWSGVVLGCVLAVGGVLAAPQRVEAAERPFATYIGETADDHTEITVTVRGKKMNVFMALFDKSGTAQAAWGAEGQVGRRSSTVTVTRLYGAVGQQSGTVKVTPSRGNLLATTSVTGAPIERVRLSWARQRVRPIVQLMMGAWSGDFPLIPGARVRVEFGIEPNQFRATLTAGPNTLADVQGSWTVVRVPRRVVEGLDVIVLVPSSVSILVEPYATAFTQNVPELMQFRIDGRFLRVELGALVDGTPVIVDLELENE